MRGTAFAVVVLAMLGLTAAPPVASAARAPTFPASWSPDWSPNGKQLVFTTDRRGSEDLWVMSADGGNQHPLTRSAGDEWSPAWSPDGSQVAFVSDRSDPDEVAHIYVIRADGTQERQLTGGGTGMHIPSGLRTARSSSSHGTSERNPINCSSSTPTEPASASCSPITRTT